MNHIVTRYGRGILGYVDHEDYRYVAVLGTNNDWACYRHPTSRDPEWITQYGEKVRPLTAVPLFPFLTYESYRP